MSATVSKKCVSCYYEFDVDPSRRVSSYCSSCLKQFKKLVTCLGKTAKKESCKCRTWSENKFCSYHVMNYCFYCLKELKNGHHVDEESVYEARKENNYGSLFINNCQIRNNKANICSPCFEKEKLKIEKNIVLDYEEVEDEENDINSEEDKEKFKMVTISKEEYLDLLYYKKMYLSSVKQEKKPVEKKPVKLKVVNNNDKPDGFLFID